MSLALWMQYPGVTWEWGWECLDPTTGTYLDYPLDHAHQGCCYVAHPVRTSV